MVTIFGHPKYSNSYIIVDEHDNLVATGFGPIRIGKVSEESLVLVHPDGEVFANIRTPATILVGSQVEDWYKHQQKGS